MGTGIERARAPRMNALLQRTFRDAGPVALVALVVLTLWYAAAVWLNAPGVIERELHGGWTARELVAATWSQQRPVLPTPHQVARDLWSSLVDWPVDSPRNLLYTPRSRPRPR